MLKEWWINFKNLYCSCFSEIVKNLLFNFFIFLFKNRYRLIIVASTKFVHPHITLAVLSINQLSTNKSIPTSPEKSTIEDSCRSWHQICSDATRDYWLNLCSLYFSNKLMFFFNESRFMSKSVACTREVWECIHSAIPARRFLFIFPLKYYTINTSKIYAKVCSIRSN